MNDDAGQSCEKTWAQIASDFGMSADLWPGGSGDGVLDRVQAAENAAPARRRQRAASAQGAIREEHAGRRDDPRAPFMEGRLRCGAARLALAELGKRSCAPHSLKKGLALHRAA